MAWGVKQFVPKAAPKATINTPKKTTGAGLSGLKAAPTPPSFAGYGGPTPAAKPINQTPKATPQQAQAPAPQADPYDSQYYIDLADATKTAGDQVAGYTKDIGDARTGLQQTYANLAQQLALQNTAAQNAENARGGFAQGALGTTLGNIGTANQARSTAATLKEGQQEDDWNTAIQGVNDGLSTETIALGLASAARKSALVAAGQGTLGTPAPAAPPKPKPAPKSVAPTKTKPGVAVVGGKKVSVPVVSKSTPFGYRGGF